MDVFYFYTYSTSAWLGIQAASLTLVPKLIINLLAKEGHFATDLEIYFSRSLGIVLSILALIVLFFTGTIPLSTSLAEPISLDDHDPRAPYAVPILNITTLLHGLLAIYSWIRWSSDGMTGYVLGATGYGAMACLGCWCLMFGTSKARLSKRTGADKRTTGFPFKNATAYDKKKDRKIG